MNQLKCILVVADKRMRSTTAVERGITLARKYGAQLHLCIFDHDALLQRAAGLLGAAEIRSLREEFMTKRQAWLAEQAVAWAEHDVKIEHDVIWSPEPHEAILKKVANMDADLIIKDMHVEPMRQRLPHTPLDSRILRYCPVPVMMVGPSTKYRPRRIAVAVDTQSSSYNPGQLNKELFGKARLLSESFESDIHVVHVTMPPSSAEASSIALSDVYEKYLLAESQAFADICAWHGASYNRHMLNGDIAVELARFIQRMDIDILILGSNSCSARNRYLLGSTMESLLGQVECDLLLVKNLDVHSGRNMNADSGAIKSDRKSAVA